MLLGGGGVHIRNKVISEKDLRSITYVLSCSKLFQTEQYITYSLILYPMSVTHIRLLF